MYVYLIYFKYCMLGSVQLCYTVRSYSDHSQHYAHHSDGTEVAAAVDDDEDDGHHSGAVIMVDTGVLNDGLPK